MRSDENTLNEQSHLAQRMLQQMQFFYEYFPYPNRPLFLRPDANASIDTHAGFARLLADKGKSLSLEQLNDLRLRDVRHAFANSKRIALVGCGTDEPLLFRLLHPHNPIVGIDLSLKALQRAQRKISWHGLRPVDLIHGDASEALRSEGLFSHIQCYGVLHHQPNPKAMLATMSQALESSGTLRLMIYSRTGRRLERGVQKKFFGIWNTTNTTQESAAQQTPQHKTKMALRWASLKLLAWRLALPLFSPNTLARRFRYVGFSRARIADAFLHPSDHPLDLAELLEWSKNDGLELIHYEAKSFDLGWISPHSQHEDTLSALVSEEKRGNIATNIVLVFKKIGAGAWTSK